MSMMTKMDNLSLPQWVNLSLWMPYLSLFIHGLFLASWHLLHRGKHLYRLFYGTSEIPLKQARLHRIIYRRKRDPEEISRREDFVTLDDGYAPKEMLKAPEWTVYSLDENSAIFVELPKPLSHYPVDKYPFVSSSIFEEAIRFAEIEMTPELKESLHRYTEKLVMESDVLGMED